MFWIAVKAQGTLVRSSIRITALPAVAKHSVSFNKHLHTRCPTAFSRPKRSCRLAVSAIVDYPTSDNDHVLYGETVAKPSGLEIARVGLIPGYWDFTIAQDQTGSTLVGKSRFTIKSPDMGRCASA